MSATLKLFTLFSSLPADNSIPFSAAATVCVEEAEDQKRGVMLCTVVDISGSMSYGRLAQCKRSLRVLFADGKDKEIAANPELASMLPILGHKDDAMALVAFADNADVVVKRTLIADGDVAGAREDMEKLFASGGTNIRAGLEKGLELVQAHGPDEGRYGILLVLTDGEDTHGFQKAMQTARSELACVQKLRSLKMVRFISACIGSKADTALMNSLADEAEGMQIFVDEDSMHDHGIAKIAGGVGDFIRTCVRQDVRLELLCAKLTEGGKRKRQVMAEPEAKPTAEPAAEPPADGDYDMCEVSQDEELVEICKHSVTVRNGQPVTQHLAIPAAILDSARDSGKPLRLVLRLYVNDALAQELKAEAVVGTTPGTVDATCMEAECNAVVAACMREYADALAEKVGKEKAREALGRGREKLMLLKGLCLGTSCGMEAPTKAIDAAIKEIDALIKETASASRDQCDRLRGCAYRSCSDRMRGDTVDTDTQGGREDGRSLSVLVGKFVGGGN